MAAKKKLPEWVATEAPCPFEEAGFWELWIKLLESPKWKKKPLSAIQMACTRLKRFDVDFAAILVETAIEGNYQGVVFPDTVQRYEVYKSKKNGQPVTETKQQGFSRQGVNAAFNSRYGKR